MFQKLNLKRKLYLSFILMLLVPSVIIGSISFITLQNKIKEKMLLNAKQNANTMNKIISDMINSKINDVNYLAGYFNQLNTGKDHEAEALHLLEKYQVNHQELMASYIGTKEGVMLLKPDQKLPDGFDPRVRPWYQDAMDQKGKAQITKPYVDAASGKVVISVVRALDDGSGVVGFDLNLDNLAKMVKGIKFGNEGYICILDPDKKAIVHPTIKAGAKLEYAFIDKTYKSNSGTFDYTFKSEEKIMYFTTNKETGWKVLGTLVKSEFTTETLPILYNTLIVIVLTLTLGAIIATLIIRTITTRLQVLVEAANSISEGNLNIDSIEVKNSDELGQLSNSFNKMKDSLHSVIVEVNEKSELLAASSEQLSASSEETGRASEHVAATIQQVASGAENQNNSLVASAKLLIDMTNSIQQMNEKTSLISDVSTDASNQAELGGKSVEKTLSQMNSISSSVSSTDQMILSLSRKSEDIVQILDVITGIANQTNLLALNAAIEAARAGEHGKGFAVVADEVRKLAEGSSESANKITNILKEIQIDTKKSVEHISQVKHEVAEGLNVATESQDRFNEILKSMNKIVEEIQDISASSHMINQNANNLNDAMDGVKHIAEETNSGTKQIAYSSQEQLTSTEEITKSAHSLSKMAEDLRNLIANFKI